MRKAFKIIYLSGMLVLPFVLLFLPADFFDSGESVCVSQVLFEQSCYGCGMTRAIQHLLHLEFDKAGEFNKLSFIVLPLLGTVWGQEIRKAFKSFRQKKS